MQPFNKLRNVVGQEAVKAFLVSLTNVESVGFEREVAICDDSWMEFVNENFMIDASDSSQSTPSSPSGKIEDASLRRTVSQTVADTCNPAPSPHTANPMSLNKSTSLGPCKHCRESEAYQKRERSEYNILEAVVQGLPRSDLLDCFNDERDLPDAFHIRCLHGLWKVARNKLVSCNIISSFDTGIEDDLHQWRRSIAERRNLDRYNTFFTEA